MNLNLARADLKMNPQPDARQIPRDGLAAGGRKFINFAVRDPKNNFLAKRLGYCANCNLLDDVPKVDGFFSLTPREIDDVLSLFYTTTNADYPRLEDFLGVSQITAPDEVFHWQPRPTFLPFITAGKNPFSLTTPDLCAR